MDFEEFKKRYAKKLVSTGLFNSVEDELNDPEFNNRMAEIYLGLMVYSEYQNEYAKAQIEQQRRDAAKNKIYVPNGGIH